MKALAAFALVLAACSQDVDRFPVNPGGGGGGGTHFTDSGIGGDTGDGGGTISGRVCLISDPRNPLSCASTGADALTVQLGGSTTTPAADGSFTIDRPTGTNLVWFVSGTGIETSAMQLIYGTTIPAIDIGIFDMMVSDNQTTSGAGVGDIIARLTDGGSPVVSETAVASPTQAGQIYYDGVSATQWGLDATGPFGVVWVPGMAPGSAQLTLGGTVASTLTAIPVYANTVTFVLADIH